MPLLNKPVIATVALFLFLAGLPIVAGCRYTTTPLVSTKYKTVAVPIFGNRTRYRDFEFALTRQIVNEIEKKTHLKVVNNRSTADTILTGEIRDYRRVVLTENTEDVVTQERVVLIVDVTWTDNKAGEIIMSLPAFSQTAEAAFEIGESLETARDEAFRDVAERIVENMEEEW